MATTRPLQEQPISLAYQPAETPKLPVGTEKTRGSIHLERGVEVVDDLGHDAGPVDRVHGTQRVPGMELLVREQAFYDLLTVVEAGTATRERGPFSSS